MIGRGDRVLVGVSGGSDSTGLALVLSELRSRLDFDLVVAHVHHGLRGVEADAGESVAAATAADLGLPFARAGVEIAAGGNLEARARAERYRALHELAAEHSCTRIATGHTRDDQAETFLLRLLRGAGADGLAGIHPVRADAVVRPLLDCTRDQVALVVGLRGLPVVEDSMNVDRRFLRTRVRHDLLPLMEELNPQIVGLAARAADSLRGAAAAQERWVDGRLDARASELNLAAVRALPADLRSVLIRAWLMRADPELRPSARSVAGVEWLVDAGDAESPPSPHVGASVDIAPGRCVERRGDRLVMSAPTPTPPTSITSRPLDFGSPQPLPGGWLLVSEIHHRRVSLPADLWSAVCDLDKCGELAVRSPLAGDRIRPLGMTGRKKLGEVFGAQSIPTSDRASYPVITSGDELLWVPGVVRASETTVDGSTTRFALLTAKRLPIAGPETP